jgi:hypothetical protein
MYFQMHNFRNHIKLEVNKIICELSNEDVRLVWKYKQAHNGVAQFR